MLDERFAVLHDGGALVIVVRCAGGSEVVKICLDGFFVRGLRCGNGICRRRGLHRADAEVARIRERLVAGVGLRGGLVPRRRALRTGGVAAGAAHAARFLVAQRELLEAFFERGEARGFRILRGIRVAVRRIFRGKDARLLPFRDERIGRRLVDGRILRSVRNAARIRREAHGARLARDLVDGQVARHRLQRDVAIGGRFEARALGVARVRARAGLHEERMVRRADRAVRRREHDARSSDVGSVRRRAEEVLRRREAHDRALAVRFRALRALHRDIAEARGERDVTRTRRKIDGRRVAFRERGLREIDARRGARGQRVRRDEAAACDAAVSRRERDGVRRAVGFRRRRDGVVDEEAARGRRLDAAAARGRDAVDVRGGVAFHGVDRGRAHRRHLVPLVSVLGLDEAPEAFLMRRRLHVRALVFAAREFRRDGERRPARARRAHVLDVRRR